VGRLSGDPGIVWPKARVEATITGARIHLEVQVAGDAFSTFIWNVADGSPFRNANRADANIPLSEDLSKILKKREFKFAGPCSRLLMGAADRYRQRSHGRLLPSQRAPEDGVTKRGLIGA